ncbi:helix-turn-helix transcriptional regulator [Flavobacterium sp.]|uniref:helix-turn-helix transcriptional regulator n=1 Tax=Flavobacterium sp. TaxID=239 RepID=UPI003752E698
MEKTKLIQARTKRGFTQQQLAEALCVDVSNYNRREKGQIKISNTEWEKLSKILETPIEEIYEQEDSMVFICKDNATGNYQGNNHIYSIPEYFLDNQKKYIQKLEEENQNLKNEMEKLR